MKPYFFMQASAWGVLFDGSASAGQAENTATATADTNIIFIVLSLGASVVGEVVQDGYRQVPLPVSSKVQVEPLPSLTWLRAVIRPDM